LINEKLPYFIEKVNIRLSQQIKIGEPVIAIGSPRGLENTISTGIVSGIRHEERTTYLQTTAPISSGSSGGGLFDLSGNLIGITTMSYKKSQAINFAVAIDEFDVDN
jgi:S1-C subfamily serine protease